MAATARSRSETATETLRSELDELTASMCRALNDPKRLYVMYLLADCPMSVGELCQALVAPQANVSQHLGVLRDRGLVQRQRQGNRVVYSLRHPKILEAVDILREVMADEATRRQELAPRS